MDISSTQRLAAYTRDLGIERARTADASKVDPGTASGRAKSSGSAEASGVQVSLSASAQALSEDAAEGAKHGGNNSAAAAAMLPSKHSEPTNGGPRSNRSLAVEAYQKNASAISGSRIQVIA